MEGFFGGFCILGGGFGGFCSLWRGFWMAWRFKYFEVFRTPCYPLMTHPPFMTATKYEIVSYGG